PSGRMSTSRAQTDGQSCGQTERMVRSGARSFMSATLAEARRAHNRIVVMGGILRGDGIPRQGAYVGTLVGVERYPPPGLPLKGGGEECAEERFFLLGAPSLPLEEERAGPVSGR